MKKNTLASSYRRSPIHVNISDSSEGKSLFFPDVSVTTSKAEGWGHCVCVCVGDGGKRIQLYWRNAVYTHVHLGK